MEFFIDLAYVCDVTIHRTYSIAKDPANPTPAELFKMLSSDSNYSSTHSEDHPEFTALRNRLEKEGYISVEHRWWNGDRVLKKFKLNGVLFKKHEKFCCAAAMKWHLTHANKRKTVNNGVKG